MTANDVLLLDGAMDDLLQQGLGKGRGEALDIFALTQILKEWALSLDEILAGWIDGPQDGGAAFSGTCDETRQASSTCPPFQ